MIANRYLCYIATLAVLSLPISAPAVTTRAYAQPTSTVQTKEQALKIEVYNPGPGAMFPVASVLVTGKQDAILIDTQFSAADARKLVDLVQSSGKRLVAVYISQSDPDYYFGLDIVQKAFPDVPILATPQTIARMKETVDGKLKVWGRNWGECACADCYAPATSRRHSHLGRSNTEDCRLGWTRTKSQLCLDSFHQYSIGWNSSARWTTSVYGGRTNS